MDSYEIIREIGVGSFGSVLLVQPNSELDQLQVLKRIPVSTINKTPGSCNEIEILSNLLHPNVIGYRGFFQDNGNLYIGMEYCELGDLAVKIAERKIAVTDSTTGTIDCEIPGVPQTPDEKADVDVNYFPESQVWVWFLQICLGLSYVHEKKILHRDLKAQNIFISQDGTIKIGDFGIARSLTNPDDFAKTQIGTPYYLSPEIVENLPYDTKTDIWALGCLLYELCALKHPFSSKNMKILLYRILKAAYEPIPDNFSRFMTCLCAKMLNLSPNKRPSAGEILKMRTVGKLIGIIKEFIPNPKVREELASQLSSTVSPTPSTSDTKMNCVKCGKPSSFARRGSQPLTTKELADQRPKRKEECRKCHGKHHRSILRKSSNSSVSTEQSSKKSVFKPLVPAKPSLSGSLSSLFGKADTLKAELELELGEDKFKVAYRGLIQEGRWGEADNYYLAANTALTAKFRELLLLECANEVS